MGSFTRDMSSEIAFWKAAQWIWTPLAMAAWNPQNMHNNGSLIALALLWSCCVGILVSFAVPSFRRWLHKPLYPPATHHDNTRNA
jgi:hypothetical protein